MNPKVPRELSRGPRELGYALYLHRRRQGKRESEEKEEAEEDDLKNGRKEKAHGRRGQRKVGS